MVEAVELVTFTEFAPIALFLIRFFSEAQADVIVSYVSDLQLKIIL